MSVGNALAAAGGEVMMATAPEQLDGVSHVVLPGVGSFPAGMERLQRGGWVRWLRQLPRSGTSLLGICLGMQLLADTGSEHASTEGLGLIPGTVEPLQPTDPRIRIPHIGWNDVHVARDGTPLGSTSSGPDAFYFVHSFAFVPSDPRDAVATTDHGGPFVSAVARDNVLGVQFHPEKSQRAGLELLRSFLALDPAGSGC